MQGKLSVLTVLHNPGSKVEKVGYPSSLKLERPLPVLANVVGDYSRFEMGADLAAYACQATVSLFLADA